MDRGKEQRPRFWEQTRPISSVPMRTYRCPTDGTVLFSVPEDTPIPEETEIVTCPKGHKVRVPKFKRPT